jgi:type I restriction enzyme S subunit
LIADMKSFDSLIEQAHHATALLHERLSALISAAVTGQIDVRGMGDLAVALY